MFKMNYLNRFFLLIVIGSLIGGAIGSNELVLPIAINEIDIELINFKNGKILHSTLVDTISIHSNDEFLYKSQLYNWIGNGSLTNPFLIQNYYLNLSNQSLIGINIQNTTYHFVIENVTIIGGSAGFLLNGVTNAHIRNNTA